MSDILNIAGRIHSISEEGIVTTASEIKDEGVNKRQSTINAEVQSELGNQSAAIDALENQNYVNISATNSDTSIEDVFTRLGITPSADTIYRVANWKYDATTKYNTSYFSEYSVNISGSTVTYVPLMVVNLGIDEAPVAGSDNLVQSGGVALLTKGGNVYYNLTNIDLSSLDLLDGSFRSGNLYSAGKSYIIPVSSLSYNNLVVTADSSYCYIGYSHDAVEHVSSTTSISNTNLLKIEQVGNGTKIFTVPSEIGGQTIEYVYIVRNTSTTIYNVNASEFSSREQYGGINTINLSKNGEVYATKADARNLVPNDMKFKGLELKYLMSGGWVDEYFLGSEWSTGDSAWSPNVVIDNSLSLGSSNPVANKTIAKELGNVVVAEGSGTSSTSETVNYIPWTELGYTLPSGTKLYIEVEGVGSGQPVGRLKVLLNSNSGTYFFVSDSRQKLLEEDVSKIRVSSLAYDTSYSGEVSVSIRYIGTTIEQLQESIAATNERIDETNVEVTSIDTDIHGVDEFELGSYEGAPIPYGGTSATSTLYISSPTLPDSTKPLVVGGNLEISVEGIGSAIKEYVLSINGVKKKHKVGLLEIPVTETVNTISIYTTSAQIIDSSQQISVSVTYKYDSLAERLDNSKGSTYDFDTDFIVDKFATDKENNEFTDSFIFSISGDSHAHKNMIVAAYAMFVNDVDDSVPTIQFKYLYGNTVVHTSTAYTIGKKDEYCKKEWRVPAFMDNCSIQVVVTIPSNVTLYISEFTNYYSDTINRNTVGYRMNAHLSFYGFNTLNAWDESAKLGYPCAIVVPKITYDGVWVCFHDDSLSNQLIDADGHTPADNHPGETLTISSLTYSELQTYTYKENKFGEYLKVAKLEDFFMVCAKTGMHPMFSWHPVSSAEEMQDIKTMAKKFGLLPYLNIKMAFSGGSSVSALDRAYSVFGSEIESYTGDVNVDTDISTIITALDTTDAAQNKDKVRVGLELFNSRLGNDTSKVQAILDAGYFAAIAWMTADPTGEQLEYWIRNGVTEFTEYDMFSYGLNW